MTKGKYDEIIAHVNEIDDINDKIVYLGSAIETTDYEMNGYNDELVYLLKKHEKDV